MEVQTVVRENAVSGKLGEVITACIAELNGSYGKLVSRIVEPEYYDSRDTHFFSVPQIMHRCVHCVFQTESSFLWFGRRKKLVFAITEPDIVFDGEGHVGLTSILCFCKTHGIKDLAEEKVLEYAKTFNIAKVTFVLDTIV